MISNLPGARSDRGGPSSLGHSPERAPGAAELSLPASAASKRESGSELCWTNILFLLVVHALAGVGVWWAIGHFSLWTALLGLGWFVLCGMSITAGYHRLFAHRSYEAAPALRFLTLLFGAASAQNSALHWANNHRVHHSKVDKEGDPYNIKRGFFWAHIGWVLYQEKEHDFKRVRDLRSDPLVMWQHRNYLVLGIAAGALLPMGLGALWGDALGALLIAGFLRLVVQYHVTFATNSVAHMVGARPYDRSTSARDLFLTAVLTFGEGYHNFHHRFQNDYRNGVRRRDFDPTKWLIWTLSRLGFASNLRRVPVEKIQRARRVALEGKQTPRVAPEAAPLTPLGATKQLG